MSAMEFVLQAIKVYSIDAESVGCSQFTCMKDMVQNSVLVFGLSSDVSRFPSYDTQNSDQRLKFDLFASPEDLADTWGPARFIADSPHGLRLFAIEIGGGTISRGSTGSEKQEKLHWSAGPVPYRAHQLTFNSRAKVLIGAKIGRAHV